MYSGLLDYIAFISTETGQPYDLGFYDSYLNDLLNEPRLKLHDNKVEKVQLALWDQLIPKLNNPASKYWKQRRIRDRFSEITVPVVHIAGLTNDGDMPDTVRNYLALTAVPSLRLLQRLILGWWPHSGSGPYGDFRNVSAYLLDRINAYLDFYLKGIDSPLLKEKPVQVYSKGQEKWIYEDQWPLTTGVKELELHLSADGELSDQPAKTSGIETYTADPSNIPSHITQTRFASAQDQLVFLTRPLTKSLNILGDSGIRLFVSGNAQDSDFIVLLFKRDKDGNDELLAPVLGMMQGRYRNGPHSKPLLMTPGDIYELNIPICPVSGGVLKGERIGILISSNLNPSVVRNANSGKKIGKDTAFQTADQKIFYGADTSSLLTLTVRR